MAVINLRNIKDEWVFFLRNSDILTITERGVSTTTEEGTWSSDTSQLINKTNVKNIRSITVDASPIIYGTDFTVDTDFDDSGIKKTKITLVAAQTGAFIITYDFGTDSIFPDYPKDNLSLSSYPRVACDILGVDSEPLGFGDQKVADNTNIILTALVYASKTTKVDATIDLIRSAVKTSERGFFYFKYIRMASMGPLIDTPVNQRIIHRNIDFISAFNIETA